MGRRRVVRGLVVFGVAATFGLSWHHELFLFVVAIPAAVITLAVQERLADSCDARRAAALALSAPTGIVDATAVERIVAADLAAAAMDDTETINRAMVLAERTLKDPWQRALACERLGAAKEMASGPASSDITLSDALRATWVRVSAVVAMSASLLIAIKTGHKALLAPFGLSFSAFVLASSESRRCEHLSDLLVRQATTEPPAGGVVVPDEAVVVAIAALAEGRPRVLRRARRFVAAASSPERAVARRRLDAIRISDGPISRLDRDIACCAVLAAALVASLEAV